MPSSRHAAVTLWITLAVSLPAQYVGSKACQKCHADKLPVWARTAIRRRTRGEIFNLFNRVQFGQPNTVVTTAANPTTGLITTQIDQPRLIQLALKVVF